MARPRVRRKIRNPSQKVSRKQKNRMDISFENAHPLVKDNWDKKKTLHQNYESMGLMVSLNGAAGGTGHEAADVVQEMMRVDKLKNDVEWRMLDDSPDSSVDDCSNTKTASTHKSSSSATLSKKTKPVGKFSVSKRSNSFQADQPELDLLDFTPIEAEIEVDSRTKRLGVKMSTRRMIEPTSPATSVNPIIATMQEEANNVVKLIRHTSSNEDLVYADLISKHGLDYEAMSKDLKLNRYQLTKGQLQRKIRTLVLVK